MKHFIIVLSVILFLAITYGYMIKYDENTNSVIPILISELVEVVPLNYDKALRNPLKGFTTRGIYYHEWATLAHTYIKWNEIENDESDDINKIRRLTDSMWINISTRNIKVIPRVYLL